MSQPSPTPLVTLAKTMTIKTQTLAIYIGIALVVGIVLGALMFKGCAS